MHLKVASKMKPFVYKKVNLNVIMLNEFAMTNGPKVKLEKFTENSPVGFNIPSRNFLVEGQFGFRTPGATSMRDMQR